MSAHTSILARADDVARVADVARLIQRRLGGLAEVRWRSPAALAWRAELGRIDARVARAGAALEALAGDLRRLAALEGGPRHG